jgi:4-carboxymuconolactone decarboxylase
MTFLAATTLAMVAMAGATAAQDQRRDIPRVAPEIVRETVPPLAAYTDELLFADVWARPGLSPRDRSLVTVAALIAGGKAEQLRFHLGRAMDAGMTRDEVAEAVTHLAFYTGWPNAMSAVPVLKAVFDERPAAASQTD